MTNILVTSYLYCRGESCSALMMEAGNF